MGISNLGEFLEINIKLGRIPSILIYDERLTPKHGQFLFINGGGWMVWCGDTRWWQWLGHNSARRCLCSVSFSIHSKLKFLSNVNCSYQTHSIYFHLMHSFLSSKFGHQTTP